MDKKLVIPGEFLSDDIKLADEGTYVEDGKVFSSVFGIASLKNHVKVVPLSGTYIPRQGDLIIEINVGVLNRADGSCYFEFGGNKVIAAVYWPREVHPRHMQKSTSAVVRYRYCLLYT